MKWLDLFAYVGSLAILGGGVYFAVSPAWAAVVVGSICLVTIATAQFISEAPEKVSDDEPR